MNSAESSQAKTQQSKTQQPKTHLALGFVGWLILCYLPSLTAVFVSTGDWYQELNKPSWNPPSWLFGPVWMTLYTMMAVSAWLVWRRGGWSVQWRPLSVFVVQLALNALWTPLFFAMHLPGVALVEIALLWLMLVITIGLFYRVHRSAAGLLLPYLGWVSFAAFLNYTIWHLNS